MITIVFHLLAKWWALFGVIGKFWAFEGKRHHDELCETLLLGKLWYVQIWGRNRSHHRQRTYVRIMTYYRLPVPTPLSTYEYIWLAIFYLFLIAFSLLYLKLFIDAVGKYRRVDFFSSSMPHRVILRILGVIECQARGFHHRIRATCHFYFIFFDIRNNVVWVNSRIVLLGFMFVQNRTDSEVSNMIKPRLYNKFIRDWRSCNYYIFFNRPSHQIKRLI